MPKALTNGSTDVSLYFVMRDATTHAPKTDVTVTNIDIYYQEQGAAQSAKADLTALAAADSAHADNKGFHCGNGLYRIDWPDAAFDGGAGKTVILVVVCTGCDTIYREIQLSPPVGAAASVTAGVTLADDAITAAKFDESTAFPLKSADTGATAVARTGADADTLETLSDELVAMKGATFDGGTDSLEAIRNRGDAAWITGAGGSAPTVEQIRTEMDSNSSKLAALYASIITNAAGADVAADIIAAKAVLDDILADTGTDGVVVAAGSKTGYALTAAYDAAKTAAAAGAQMDLVNAPNATALAAVADKFLGRNIAGGSDGGRTVTSALRSIRNRIAIALGVMTVYAEDDTTPAWTGAVTTDASADPITEIDPA